MGSNILFMTAPWKSRMLSGHILYFWRDAIFGDICPVAGHREESGLAPAIRSVYKLERAYCSMLVAHEKPQLLLYSYTVV